ncbi:MAG: helix-turn-helix domain-containing protein [Mariprofundales bacterium]|nr:helix-turn-helix domain-containing protein [Mariprofundales bacterium]
MGNISEKIKALRKMRGWTQVQLSEAAGIGRVSVTQWESGRCSPDRDSALALARALNVNPQWLITGEGDQYPPPATETPPLSPIMQRLMAELIQLPEDEQRRELQAIQEKNELRELRKMTGTGVR